MAQRHLEQCQRGHHVGGEQVGQIVGGHRVEGRQGRGTQAAGVVDEQVDGTARGVDELLAMARVGDVAGHQPRRRAQVIERGVQIGTGPAVGHHLPPPIDQGGGEGSTQPA